MSAITCMMKERHGWLAGLLLAGLLIGTGQARAQDTVSLQSVSFADLPGDQFEVQVEFDGTPPEPGGFVLEDPPRIAIDLPATRSALGQREYPVSSGNTESLLVLETAGRTRLLFNLRDPGRYETRIDGNTMIVSLTGSEAPQDGSGQRLAAAPDADAGQSEPEMARASDDASSGTRVIDVNFRSGDARGEGVLVLELSDTGAVISTDRTGRQVQAVLDGVEVPADFNRRFDVSDFATPVSTVDVLPDGGDALVEMRMAEDYDYVAWQEGRYLNIGVSPVDTAGTSDDPASQYSDVLVTLTFQDIDVRSVLQILAEENDFNLVVSDAVSGSVTLHLEEVPWDQALDLVLQSRNLDKRMVGNVLYVAPSSEIAAQQQLALEASRQAEALEPLHTEYIQVNYADAGNILSLLTGSESGSSPQQQSSGEGQSQGGGDGGGSDVEMAAGGGDQSRGILSSRGTATVDERTNIIIIRDVASKLAEVREMLSQLDIPVRQVLIEARIVNVSTDFGRDLGIRWGAAGRANGDSGFHYGGSLESSARQAASGDGEVDTFPDALAVDLGADSEEASSFAIGFARDSHLIELELSALESTGNGEVIARPKVTTQDKVMANIQSGVRIPYQAQAGGTAGGSTTEFVDAVLSLEVTPQITPDGRIIMELSINQDSVAPSSGQVPAINTNSVNTSVLVDDGDTVVLGGIFREETTTTESKTPLLGDVPYLGRLFSRTSTDRRRTELLIFITPRIIAEWGGGGSR
ncbi:MAG: type IV pilus secretin PilQ [Pseudohongiellaceae bacterium]